MSLQVTSSSMMEPPALSLGRGLFFRRAQLEELRSNLERQLAPTEDIEVVPEPDPADREVQARYRYLDASLRGNEARTLRRVRYALEAIDAGDYGTCEDCGEEIPSRRLDAVPWAVRCVKCERQQECSSTS